MGIGGLPPRAISTTVAEALLVLVAIAAVALAYLWLQGAAVPSQQPPPTAAGMLKLDHVYVVKGSTGYCVYVVAIVRNVGPVPVAVNASSVAGYLLGPQGGEPLYAAPPAPLLLRPGEAARLILVPETFPRGASRVKIVVGSGVEASAVLPRLDCRPGASSSSRVLVLQPVDGYSVSETLPGGLVMKANVTQAGTGEYKVTYEIYAPTGVTVYYTRAEIVTVNGTHPRYAANPVVEYTTSFTGPNYVSDYWTPVLQEEFPVAVMLTAAYTYNTTG